MRVNGSEEEEMAGMRKSEGFVTIMDLGFEFIEKRGINTIGTDY